MSRLPAASSGMHDRRAVYQCTGDGYALFSTPPDIWLDWRHVFKSAVAQRANRSEREVVSIRLDAGVGDVSQASPLMSVSATAVPASIAFQPPSWVIEQKKLDLTKLWPGFSTAR